MSLTIEIYGVSEEKLSPAVATMASRLKIQVAEITGLGLEPAAIFPSFHPPGKKSVNGYSISAFMDDIDINGEDCLDILNELAQVVGSCLSEAFTSDSIHVHSRTFTGLAGVWSTSN